MAAFRRLPPEWAPQSGVMLTWPHDETDWAPQLHVVEPLYVALVREISRREGVLVVCRDATHREHVHGLLGGDPGVRLDHIVYALAPSNDSWARDHGPLTVLQDNEALLLDFRFNGWGGKFEAQADDAITRCCHAQGVFGGAPREAVDMVLEGGSVEIDEEGTLLTTAHCLLTPTRNPELAQDAIEARLKSLFGAQRVLWLHHGELDGDDTDAHIDTLARFCGGNRIAYVSCDDPEDSHYTTLKAMETELQGFTNAAGAAYELIPLPMARPAYDEDGRRLPATYANFLIINEAVLVPVYAMPEDDIALARLGEAFPDRQIIPLDCRPLIRQNGSLHCITMQLPSGVLSLMTPAL